MDENIYNLNLDYLILAHELIQSGRKQQAMVSLGLTSEAVTILAKMPVDQLKVLARSDVLSFAPRFSVHSWRTFLRNEPMVSEPFEQHALRLRMLLSKPGSQSC
jgi:flagellar transcriptional activator FlhD